VCSQRKARKKCETKILKNSSAKGDEKSIEIKKQLSGRP